VSTVQVSGDRNTLKRGHPTLSAPLPRSNHPDRVPAPIGAEKTTTARVYRQIHENAVSASQPSAETQAILRRFDQEQQFAKSPEATILLLHRKQ